MCPKNRFEPGPPPLRGGAWFRTISLNMNVRTKWLLYSDSLHSKTYENIFYFFKNFNFGQNWLFYQKIGQFFTFSANIAKTKKDIKKSPYTFLDNILRIIYMKYEHISSNRYRVLVTKVFEYFVKNVDFWPFCDLSRSIKQKPKTILKNRSIRF